MSDNENTNSITVSGYNSNMIVNLDYNNLNMTGIEILNE